MRRLYRSPMARSLLACSLPVCLLLCPFLLAFQEPANVIPVSVRFAESDFKAVEERVQAAKATVEKANADLLEVTNRIGELQSKIAVVEKERVDLDAQVKKIDEDLKLATKALEEAQANQKKVTDDPASTDEAKKAAENQVGDAQKKLETLQADLKAQQEELKKRVESKTGLEKELEIANNKLKPAQDNKGGAEKIVADFTGLVTEVTRRREGLSVEGAKPDPTSIRLLRTFTLPRPPMSVKFSPVGDRLYAGLQDNTVQGWNFVFNESVAPCRARSWICSLEVSKDGEGLIAAAYDGRLGYWDQSAQTPVLVRNIPAHIGHIRWVTFSPDQKYLATGGNDQVVRVWNSSDGTKVAELTGHQAHVYCVSFDPKGTALVTGDLLGVIKHWEVGTWKHVRDLDAATIHKYDEGFRAHCGGVRAFAFSPDLKYLAAGGIADVTNAFAGVGIPTVCLFDWESGKKIHDLKPKEGINGSIWGLSFDPSGFLIGAGGGGGGGAFWFWKPDQNASYHHFPLPSAVYGMDVHPDLMRIAVALYDRTVRVYDMSPEKKP